MCSVVPGAQSYLRWALRLMAISSGPVGARPSSTSKRSIVSYQPPPAGGWAHRASVVSSMPPVSERHSAVAAMIP